MATDIYHNILYNIYVNILSATVPPGTCAFVERSVSLLIITDLLLITDYVILNRAEPPPICMTRVRLFTPNLDPKIT